MHSVRHPLKDIVRNYKQGTHTGIYSICSANELVVKAAMERTLKGGGLILIEATANQVNQYGGYTGMKPADFRDFIFSIAEDTGFPFGKIILGGDHLGPLTWKDKPADIALKEAEELIRQFVAAGFSKIHIDTSMRLADDDKSVRLDTNTIAARGAILCKAAERAFSELKESKPGALQPVYVIGSEVPIPGGAQEEEAAVRVTRPEDFEETVGLYKDAFYRHGLANAWENVIAVVVQPGVEFGDESIHAYDRKAAGGLTAALKKFPGMVFEGHSTDYQTAASLKSMVEDGIIILKVGPALTFALREGLFDLSLIEKELLGYNRGIKLSHFMDVLDAAMAENPEYWEKHYHGDGNDIRLARKYSFSDRCRYYLPDPKVREALDLLLENLSSADIPLTLISQYMPVQYGKIRDGLLKKEPLCLLKDKVVNRIDDYIFALGG